MAGGAAVWCWCEVLPVCCRPVLYSYVGRGGVRSPTGAGIICPARPVRGDLSSVAGCCCPLLYSYVGRRRAISYRRGHHRPGAGRRRGVACPASSGGGRDLLPARHHRAATGKPPTENGQQKRGRRGGGPCLPLFSRHTSGVSSGAGGWNPSRAILSRVAFTM